MARSVMFVAPEKKRNSALAAAALIAIVPAGAWAQVQPDAGLIHQEIERSRAPRLAPRPPVAPVVEEPARPALTAAATVRFPVSSFRITRTTAFTEAELLPLLKDFIGKDLSLADLQRAADLITRFYRERGYFVARAYVPAQDIKDGIVEITVLEGKLDRISLMPTGETRLRDSVVEARLRAALAADGLIREADLERGLLLLSDIPGVGVRSVLSPGAVLGTSMVTAELSEGPLVSGNIDIANYGNKFSGYYLLGGTINLNDPSGYGDLLSLRATASSGTSYGWLAYQIPLGYSGLRLGAAYSESRYELCCEFSSLRARGDAQTATLIILYPFFRGRDFSLYGTAAYGTKRYFNSTIVGTTSDRKADVVTLGANGDSRDFLGGGGLSSFGFAVSSGQLNLDGWAPDRAADAATARTHGGYIKATYSLTRLQLLGEATSLYAGLGGQLASKNLDSSEKFILGGPLGVRAYPVGEASGDEGLLLNLELRYDIDPTLQLAAFVDHGEVRLHKTAWAGWQGANTRIGNRYGLSGYGIGLNWNQPGNFFVRAAVAHRIGDNPGRDANGNDSDNTKNRTQWWLQAVKYF